MPAPFIFISTHAINEDKLEDYATHLDDVLEFEATNEPGLLDFQIYLNDEQSEVTFVRVFPDASAADVHLRTARDHIDRGRDMTKTGRLEVYGTPGPLLEQVLAHNAEQGVPLSLKPNHVGGFSRTAIH